MTAQEKVDLITHVADEMKAEDIAILDIREKTSVADFFIVCTANNDRLVEAIADKVAEKMRSLKERALRTEGAGSGWVLQDYGDVVLHVMRDEQRQFYDLETLWKSMNRNPDLA